MTDKYIEGIAGLLVGLMAGIIFALLINNASWHDEAVESGHAEYYLDAMHIRQWRWKTIVPPTISVQNWIHDSSNAEVYYWSTNQLK